nr:probable protein phosphatase 2C 21 isoform X2 [Setaria viridis]
MWSPSYSCISCIHEIANMKYVMLPSCCRMDELLQQSNEWMELVIPAASRNWIRRLIKAIVIDTLHCKWGYIPPQNLGCSATVAVARGSRVTVGNVGSCRCVASRNGQAIQLSTDHIPRNRGERRRIQRAGGTLELDKYVAVEALRGPGYRAYRGILATSRAIGSFVFKQNKNLPPEEQLVICNPDIHSMEITDDVEFLVIANCGVWLYMTSQGVVDFVHEQLGSGETDLRVICQRLVRRVQPARPDATAMLIQFKHAAPDAAEGSEEDSDDQEIKSDAGDEGQQPSAPDRETVSRALEFVRSKQREHKGENLSGATAQSSSLRRRMPS